ncbi:MAG: hypothetical protein WAX44_03560 [Minisyncoccia bacterium]
MFFLTWLFGKSQVVARVFIRTYEKEEKIEVPSDTFGLRDILEAELRRMKETCRREEQSK